MPPLHRSSLKVRFIVTFYLNEYKL